MEFGFHTNPHLSIGPDPLGKEYITYSSTSCPSAIGVQIKPQKKKKKSYWAENKIIGITQYSDKEEEEEEEEEEGDSTERKRKTSQLNQRQREIVF